MDTQKKIGHSLKSQNNELFADLINDSYSFNSAD